MKFIADKRVQEIISSYPDRAQEKLHHVRELILEVASEIDGLTTLEETLKWGEPSYVTKYGSTLRMDWKQKNPEKYALYFQCTSRLVPTFKLVYKGVFNFEGNRAIVLDLDQDIPEEQLKDCIAMTLNYHRLKHMPLLGA